MDLMQKLTTEKIVSAFSGALESTPELHDVCASAVEQLEGVEFDVMYGAADRLVDMVLGSVSEIRAAVDPIVAEVIRIGRAELAERAAYVASHSEHPSGPPEEVLFWAGNHWAAARALLDSCRDLEEASRAEAPLAQEALAVRALQFAQSGAIDILRKNFSELSK